MPRAIITNRIFIETNPEVEKELLRNLTYSIANYRTDLPPRIITTARIIRDGLMSIPSGRVDLIPKDYQIVQQRVSKPVEFPEFKYKLRPSQQEVYDAVNSDCFINAWTSWGKTFTGLAVVGKLSQKTLIIVHTLALRDQWRDEIRKVYNIEPSIIGSGMFDTSGLITIANVQSLYKAPPDLINKSFGTIVVDECHHIPSRTFSAIIDANHATYKIGLSASARRKDGLHVLFPDFFGKTHYKPPRENYMVPEIHRIQLPIRLSDGTETWAVKLNNLVTLEEYQKSIALIAASYASKGHKVLVIGSRTHLLERCQEITPGSICIIGQTKDRESQINKIKSGEAKILYGSTNILSEGISINELSCLILATPLNNEPLLEQLIGRIIRLQPNKPKPIVIDPLLIGKTANKQAQLRKGYYLRQGYEIKEL
ncbi:DEAD/DEAH box helicase [bacterium]|nr:DEAD/DEAH box helicase [bacterium]